MPGVLLTGPGKSHIVAVPCKDAPQNWLIAACWMPARTSAELTQQNAEKMRHQCRPGAPMGIHSASIGAYNLASRHAMTCMASSRCAAAARMLGHTDLVIIDECATPWSTTKTRVATGTAWPESDGTSTLRGQWVRRADGHAIPLKPAASPA